MRKYLWAIIAGVCVLALIVVGAVFIPRIFNGSRVEELGEIVMPGHWWKTDLNEQQLKTLEDLWGSDMTRAEFIQGICPGILLQLPKEGVDALAQRKMYWFGSWEDYKQAQMIHVGTSTGSRDEGLRFFEIYLGRRGEEEITFRRGKEPPIVEERCYRISIYTDSVLEAPKYSR